MQHAPNKTPLGSDTSSSARRYGSDEAHRDQLGMRTVTPRRNAHDARTRHRVTRRLCQFHHPFENEPHRTKS